MSASAPGSSSPHISTGWRFQPGRESLLAIAVVILSLTLSHLVQRVQARRIIRQHLTRNRHHSPSVHDADGKASPSASCRKHAKSTLLRAIEARANTLLYLYVLPPWLYAPDTVSDAIWTGLYCLMMLVCALWECPISDSWLYLANRFGVLAYAQTPIIFLLAVKNNPLSPLTGITYQKLNYLHRASARACIGFAWLHAVMWFLPVLDAGHLFHWYIIWGTVALVAFTALWATSLRSIRRKSFEFFIVAHILFSAAFLFGAILHWPLQAYWIWPALAIWALDRLVRLARLGYINFIHRRHGGASADNCSIEIVARDVMRVTIVRPGLRWKAGQHFFLSSARPAATGSSVHESHPFSIANLPNPEGKLIFLIRAHNGFTRRLLDLSSSPPRLLLEGPYGHSHPLTHFHSVLLISGGTGITFTLSHFLSLLDSVRSGQATTRWVKLVWHVRHAEDVSWISPILDKAMAEYGAGLEERVRVEVEVWVTRGEASAEPWEGTGSSTPLDGGGPQWDQGRVEAEWALTSAGTGEMAERGRNRERAEVDEMTRLLPRLEGISSTERPLELGISDRIRPPRPYAPPAPPSSSPHPQIAPPPQSHPAKNRPSPETQHILSLHAGRANLAHTITSMADDLALEATGGGMMVVACGPVPLMSDARRAVGRANSWERIRKGGRAIEYLEETVGH